MHSMLIASLCIAVHSGGGFLLKSSNADRTREFTMSVVVVLGIGVLLVLLFLMAAGSAALGIADSSRALGHPSGSNRGLIAFFLLSSIYSFRQTAVLGSEVRIITAQQYVALCSKIGAYARLAWWDVHCKADHNQILWEIKTSDEDDFVV